MRAIIGHFSFIAFAVVVAVGGAFASAQPAGEPTMAELKAQIDSLQRQVERLEAKQQQTAGTPTKDEVMADAQKRSEPAMTGGYEDGKFILRARDDSFSLSPGAQLQFRYIANSRDDDTVGDDFEDGFDVRRAKFSFAGNVINEDTTYNIQWETNENSGDVTLEEAWVRFKLKEDWHLRLGQIKDDVFHEETTSSKRQLAVERSLLNELLAGGETDYVQGARVEWDATEALRLNAMIHDGYNSDNTPFSESGGSSFIGVGPTELGFSGRIEYFAQGAGAKKLYDDFSAMRNKSNLLVVGAGADYSLTGDSHAFFHSLDVQYENTEGFALYGAAVGLERDIDANDPAGAGSTYDWGFLVQAGYMFSEKWEGFARWDVTFLDDELLAGGAEDTINEFTLGVNCYLNGHAAKFTVDASYLPDGSPNNESGIGVLATDEESFIFRGQFQLLL
ncbi:MAG: OprO/OprP family phosphate-selective porin [Planctomycetota bacterium]|nr:OprO/OprP family phosphate-selective porin [Planctomycetota bacterium]